MSCGLHGRKANKANLLSGHARFLLSQEKAASIIDCMIDVIKTEWEATLKRAGASNSDINAIRDCFIYVGFFNPITRQ